MKKIIIPLLITILITSCTKQELDIHFITQEFKENIDKIEKVQYNVQNIMTFSDGTVWDNNGFVLLEKDKKDSIFGFSFYGIRNDINRSSIYKDGIGFQIINEENNFRQEKGGLHFLGSPGGQMVYKDFFKLEDEYKNVEVLETENSYRIIYSFEDVPKYGVTNRTKVLELNFETFLPRKVTTSSETQQGKQSTVYIFKDVKTNNNLNKNIADYIKGLNKLELIKNENPKPNPLLKKPLPKISLRNLLNENETIQIKNEKITLIDFWEVWCGYCIKAFPEVEKLKNKYENDINVIGIVSQEKENAIKLVESNETTFLNLIGNKKLIKEFNIKSWPSYFLVDKNGIIQKEYRGFSNQIEKDIQELIEK